MYTLLFVFLILHILCSFSSTPGTIDGWDSDYLFLSVQQSTLPIHTAGEGVFAKLDLEANDIICEYRGVAIDPVFEQHFVSDKFFNVRTNDGTDWRLIGQSVCSKINDAAAILTYNSSGLLSVPYTFEDIQRFDDMNIVEAIPTFPGYEYNARSFAQGNGKIFVVATKNIRKGEEIFYAYGTYVHIIMLLIILVYAFDLVGHIGLRECEKCYHQISVNYNHE